MADRLAAALSAGGVSFGMLPAELREPTTPTTPLLIPAEDASAALQVLGSLPGATVVDVRARPGGISVVAIDAAGDTASLEVMNRITDRVQPTRDPHALASATRRGGVRSERRNERCVLVVLLGPDGSGKSSVIAAARERLRGVPLATHAVHLRPRVLRRRSGDNQVHAPHGRPPKGRWASHLQLAYWWLEYQLDWIATSARGRQELRWSDRYVDDLVVDPQRFRYGGSMRFAGWIAAHVPRPRLVVLLDAPAEVIQRRKQEVAAVETERQRQAYLAHVRALPNGRVVDASRPLDQVVADVVHLVVGLLAERAAARLEAIRT